MASVVNDPDYFTADLPGISGTLKRDPADFLVEEIPAYEPSGSGEHLFLWVEKTDVSADELVKTLARELEIDRREIGTAGLKDRRAVTRQYVSVPAACEKAVAGFVNCQIRILSAKRHFNKLKTGHLRGNRFTIRVREPSCPVDEALERAKNVAQALREHGLPNYYGQQRFGRDGETLALGRALLKGERSPKSIPPGRRRFLLRLALSAAQADLFNQALTDRLRRGEFATVFAGDVMRKTDRGGIFLASDPETEQGRFDAGAIDITGPMFGPKMTRAAGPIADREETLLAESGLSIDAFRSFRKLTPGGRRPYRAEMVDLDVSGEAEGLAISVTLGAGTYATILAREFIK